MWSKDGVNLPEGTRLRLVDRLEVHDAVVRNGALEVRGEAFAHPSGAAQWATGKGFNGWAYWLAKRPGEAVWTPLSWFRAGLTADDGTFFRNKR